MAKVLCIEIGTATTKIVEMDYQVKKPRVYRCVEVTTPAEAIKDGYLNQKKLPQLKEAIKGALTEHKIRTKRVLFTIFSGKIISREITLPAVKPHQINAVIESNVTEYFPIELDDYKISNMLIQTFREGENAGKHKVLVIAAEKELLAAYDRLAEELGLRLVDIDYTGNSLLQATRNLAGSDAVIIVKPEEENSIITIIRQGNLVLQRTVNHAAAMMPADELSAQEVMETLVSTMLRIIDFYVTNAEDHKIQQIYVIGEGSREQEVVSLIEKQTQIPCRMLDHIRGVNLYKTAQEAQINLFAAAIGAGLGSVGFANEKEKERKETNYVSASVLLIVFFVVAVAAVVSLALIPYHAVVVEEEALLRQQETYAEAQQVYDAYQGMTRLYEQVSYGYQLTMHSNDDIVQFLEELEQKLPADAELTEFSSDDEQCVMTMRVADKEVAAGVIAKLRSFESLETVVVDSLVEETQDGDAQAAPGSEETTISFTVTCSYYDHTPVPPAAQTTQDTQQDGNADS